MSVVLFRERLPAAMEPWQSPDFSVALTSAERARYRLRKPIVEHVDIAIVLDRGRALKAGDHLVADDGRVLRVLAAAETLAHIESTDAETLARAAYHLGNRHVALQVGRGWVRFAADHVLEQMVKGLGFTVTHVEAPFEPETGAYHYHSHGHSHHDHRGDEGDDKHENLPRQGTPFSYAPRIHEFDPTGAPKRG